MLRRSLLDDLERGLSHALEAIGVNSYKLGQPEEVEQKADECKRMFQGYAMAKPSAAGAREALLAFLAGKTLDTWQRDAIASALSAPTPGPVPTIALASSALPTLLQAYELEVRAGDLWRLTWYGLLTSYFSYEPEGLGGDAGRQGWSQLRVFLESSWPLIDLQAGQELVPDWMSVMRRETRLLSVDPVATYACDFLDGDLAATDALTNELGIPASSWFWHSLVLGAVRDAVERGDEEFKGLIPRLIGLVKERAAFRDEAIELMLTRYYHCKGAGPNEALRDFVVHKEVWRNPKLRDGGEAPAWHRVQEPVWLMVHGWVDEGNLKDFFDILASRNRANEGRLDFWTKYLKQICWTRLVFGADTMALRHRNAAVRNLISREEGTFAELTANRDVDAFMARIGDYIIVEFSKQPNACYVYATAALPFDRSRRHYSGGTEDLKSGFHSDPAARITHPPNWQWGAEEKLRRLGIKPDRADWTREDYLRAQSGYQPARVIRNRPVSAPAQPHVARASISQPAANNSDQFTGNVAPRGANFTIPGLHALVEEFIITKNDSLAPFVQDGRNGETGRLAVVDPRMGPRLGGELAALGFKWSKKNNHWYYPEA